MPGVVRKGDVHVGHASPTPNPFHKTAYVAGSPDTFVNNRNVQRIGDKTSCTDPAAAGSPTVYCNGIKVHRLGDATGGHGSWVPNAAASASQNVFCDDMPRRLGLGDYPTTPTFPAVPPNADTTVTPQFSFFTSGNPTQFYDTGVTYGQNIQPVTEADVPPDHPYTPEQVDAGTDTPNPAICGEVDFVNPWDIAVVSGPNTDVWKEQWKQGGTNPMIKALWDEIGYDGAQYADETAWCAVFTGAILKRAGCEYKKTASSQAYATYGQEVPMNGLMGKLQYMKKGDIIVFYRKGLASGLGHVGFCTGKYTATTVEVLGGNQGDAMNVKSFQIENVSKGWGIKAIRRAVSCVDGTTVVPEATLGDVGSVGTGGSVT